MKRFETIENTPQYFRSANDVRQTAGIFSDSYIFCSPTNIIYGIPILPLVNIAGHLAMNVMCRVNINFIRCKLCFQLDKNPNISS